MAAALTSLPHEILHVIFAATTAGAGRWEALRVLLALAHTCRVLRAVALAQPLWAECAADIVPPPPPHDNVVAAVVRWWLAPPEAITAAPCYAPPLVPRPLSACPHTAAADGAYAVQPVLLLGPRGCGKTTLMIQFCLEMFAPSEEIERLEDAFGADDVRRRAPMIDDVAVCYEIYDAPCPPPAELLGGATAPYELLHRTLEQYHAMRTVVPVEPHVPVIILCFDLCDRASFHASAALLNGVLAVSGGPLPTLVVGTKADAAHARRAVAASEGRRLAEQAGGVFVEATATALPSTRDVFRHAAQLLAVHREHVNPPYRDNGRRRRWRRPGCGVM